MNIDELLQEAFLVDSVNSVEDLDRVSTLSRNLTEARKLIVPVKEEDEEVFDVEFYSLKEATRLDRLCGDYVQLDKARRLQAHKALREDITERERQKALELSKAKDLDEYAAIRERYMLEAKEEKP